MPACLCPSPACHPIPCPSLPVCVVRPFLLLRGAMVQLSLVVERRAKSWGP
jgi:hypothetical protein